MKVICQWCLILLGTLPVFSQVRIVGKVTNGDGKSIAFVSVLLLHNNDSSLVKGSVTNELGQYEFSGVDAGLYMIKYSAVGYQVEVTPGFSVGVSNALVQREVQVLFRNTRSLDTVAVKARVEKPLYTQSMEGMVINVQSSILTKGSSALDILSRSPGVLVEKQSASILFNGKSGIAVAINGKLLRLPLAQVIAMLNGMSADNVERIELLTAPPAKYDADGSAGMINIVLKRSEEEGTKALLNVSGGYGWGEKGVAGISLTHNTRNLNIYGSYSYTRDRSFSDWVATGTEIPPLINRKMDFDFSSATRVTKTSHDVAAGIEVTLGNNIVGGSFIFNSMLQNYHILGNGAYTIEPDSFLLMNSNLHGINKWMSTISSVYFERKLKKNESINVGFDYLYYRNRNPTNVDNIFVNGNGYPAKVNDTLFSPGAIGNAYTPIKSFVAKLDYQWQISEKVKLESGIKEARTASSSMSTIESLIDGSWVALPDKFNNLSMKENISAAYASTSIQFNSLTSLSVGLRYEYSYTHLDDLSKHRIVVDRKLGQFFPDIFFSKKVDDKSTMQISFSKRINRPSYNDLASFISYNDFVSVFTGNPSLRPTISHNLKLGYVFKGSSFSVLAGRDDYPIALAQVITSPTKEWLYISPQNLNYQNNLTFQADVPLKAGNWWKMNYGFVGGWRQFKINYTAIPVRKTYFSYSMYSTQSFRLPANFGAELSGRYFAPFYSGSVRLRGFYTVNLGVSKVFSGNIGTIQFSVEDLFKSLHIRSGFGSITEEAFDLKSHLSYNPESRLTRIFKLSYSRSFGKSSVRERKNQTIRYQEESSRVRKY